MREHYLFHYVTEGKGSLQAPEGTYDIETGCLFLIRPSEVVSYTSDKNDPWEYYWVGFNGTAVSYTHLDVYKRQVLGKPDYALG